MKEKNKNAKTKPATALKMLICGIFTKAKSINSIENCVFHSPSNRFESIFSKREFISKTHAFRDCINDIDYKNVQKIHFNMLDKFKKNKFFDNHNYRGSRVVIADGVEAFETYKDIDGLHIRNHRDGTIGHYYKSLGLM